MGIGDVAKKLGEMWNNLSDSEKQPFLSKANKLKDKYQKVWLNMFIKEPTFSRLSWNFDPSMSLKCWQNDKPVCISVNVLFKVYAVFNFYYYQHVLVMSPKIDSSLTLLPILTVNFNIICVQHIQFFPIQW